MPASIDGSSWAAWLTGVSGGLMGGLFSASGPILGWFGYSQPLALATIRATLLVSFFVSTLARTILVGIDGGLTSSVLSYAALALPVVILGTVLGRKVQPPWDETTLKKAAYILLLVMGLWILLRTLIGAVPSI